MCLREVQRLGTAASGVLVASALVWERRAIHGSIRCGCGNSDRARPGTVFREALDATTDAA
jgi:hypothetical protein